MESPWSELQFMLSVRITRLKKGHDEASRSYNRRVDIFEWETILTKEQVIAETMKQ